VLHLKIAFNELFNTANIADVNVLQPCKQYQDAEEGGSKLLCRMPVVRLLNDLTKELNDSGYVTINNTQGHGVAVYFSSDGRTRVDIYIGLKLDGFKRYENISSVDPTITLQFAPKPVVLCKHDDIEFDPNEDKVITVKVKRIHFALKSIRWAKQT